MYILKEFKGQRRKQWVFLAEESWHTASETWTGLASWGNEEFKGTGTVSEGRQGEVGGMRGGKTGPWLGRAL